MTFWEFIAVLWLLNVADGRGGTVRWWNEKSIYGLDWPDWIFGNDYF